MPLTGSSFNDLSADVNSTGFLIFFNASSHVLRKLPASAMKTASCAIAQGGALICTYVDSTPQFCSFLTDATDTYYNEPLISFGSQRLLHSSAPLSAPPDEAMLCKRRKKSGDTSSTVHKGPRELSPRRYREDCEKLLPMVVGQRLSLVTPGLLRMSKVPLTLTLNFKI
ncbi:Hypothetical predicted protein [Cloeon dipterum]|uniref:Uncharacterized protein n=1 Tax=Cloeon dipterum TaxID=197152 RepID=A0A8S1DNR2_9INSE|nr:Hypothetical predicted protein [Cloeon dipterum]